jgi:hypothetical protein
MSADAGVRDLAMHNVTLYLCRAIRDSQWMYTMETDQKTKERWGGLTKEYANLLDVLVKGTNKEESSVCDFRWALSKLLSGCEVRRKGWYWNGWVRLKLNNELLFDEIPLPSVNSLCVDDFIAEDWEFRLIAKGEY